MRVASVVDVSTGEPINAGEVRGRVLLRLDFAAGRARRLEVLAGETTVCSQSFAATDGLLGASAALAAIPFDCLFDSARFDSISGAVAFRNGPLAVRARLVGRADSVLAISQEVTLVLANRDSLAPRLSAPEGALDAAGLRWVGGPVTVTAVPVLYGSGGDLSRARFTYRTPEGGTIDVTDGAAPFAITLPDTVAPAAGGLLGLTDASLRVSVSTVLRSGEPGPGGITPAVRYDNQAPSPGGVLGREWVGSQMPFRALYDSRAESDAGWDGSPPASSSGARALRRRRS